ncbi:MAG: tRNA guanosine(34) transglycosylase Tgt [Candidatus Omnitrophota bacterium]
MMKSTANIQNLKKIFTIEHADTKTKARCALLQTAHGPIHSPFFMPVATNATVKALPLEDLVKLELQIVLSNTYHLFLRPGIETIEQAGGLHSFMKWKGPILTDSGGYQVFSLARLRKIRDDGVTFNSHLDGKLHFFAPEDIIRIQNRLGSDMMMPLDECVEYPCEHKKAQKACERTTLWAKRSKDFHLRHSPKEKGQLLFGIVQGSSFKDLRERSAEELRAIGFDGFAVGGISVGEPVDVMFEALSYCEPFLPKEQPRYLMGIGMPDQIVRAVAEGVDMFDTCVPTRYGRYGTVFTKKGKMVVRNGEFANDQKPLDEHCDCFVCRTYTRSYIRHLFSTHEIVGCYYASYHNVYFYLKLMHQIREAISQGRFETFQKEFLSCYNSTS